MYIGLDWQKSTILKPYGDKDEMRVCAHARAYTHTYRKFSRYGHNEMKELALSFPYKTQIFIVSSSW